MKIALICVLIAGLMPYLWTTVAKIAGPRYDNRNVREWQSHLTGLAQRAHAAHLNSFEAFPIFAAAVLSAIGTNFDANTLDKLAIGFVVIRLAYGIAYISNIAPVRSLIWFSGIACVVAIFVIAIQGSAIP
jgi:uncharacterized MAPEG superfamily protein